MPIKNAKDLDSIQRQLKEIQKIIQGSKLEDFGLHWFTKKRLQHINTLLGNLQTLQRIGFDTESIDSLQRILYHLMWGYGYDKKGQRLKNFGLMHFHLPFWGKRKKRKEIVAEFKESNATTPQNINFLLDRLSAQIELYLQKGNIVSRNIRYSRMSILARNGFPVEELPRQCEFLVHNWDILKDDLFSEGLKTYCLIRALTAFAAHMSFDDFSLKFEEMVPVLATSIEMASTDSLRIHFDTDNRQSFYHPETKKSKK
tara:strand:- start:11907 stop:12677 length:771 start_codon:yes stop_codon:yes gene_type:complete